MYIFSPDCKLIIQLAWLSPWVPCSERDSLPPLPAVKRPPVPLLGAGDNVGWTHWQVGHNITAEHVSTTTILSVKTGDPGLGTHGLQVLRLLTLVILCTTLLTPGHRAPLAFVMVTSSSSTLLGVEASQTMAVTRAQVRV